MGMPGSWHLHHDGFLAAAQSLSLTHHAHILVVKMDTSRRWGGCRLHCWTLFHYQRIIPHLHLPLSAVQSLSLPCFRTDVIWYCSSSTAISSCALIATSWIQIFIFWCPCRKKQIVAVWIPDSIEVGSGALVNWWMLVIVSEVFIVLLGFDLVSHV